MKGSSWVEEVPSGAVPHMLEEETLGTRAGIDCGRRARWASALVGQVDMLDADPLDSVAKVTVDTSSVSVPVAAAAAVVVVAVDDCRCRGR